MKNIKYFKFLILIFLIFSNCSSFYEAKKQNKSEEFLVEKKSPLVLPPDFEKLPIPESQTEQKNENIKDLIILKDKTNTQLQKNSKESQSLEKSIIEKIQN
tara:strand:- start:3018 stop:3320 length:303 start_codon:yes stop_codon:yes gene_type:complete